MKRKLITILAIFLPFFGAAQTIIGTGNPNQLTYQRGGYGADSVMAIPVADTSGAGATWANYRKIGRIMVNDADSTLYYHDGVKWKVVGGGGTADTNFIRNQNAYRQDGNFRINGGGETSRMIVASEELVPIVESLDTSSYGLYVAKVLAPPYDPFFLGSRAQALSAAGVYGFSAGDNVRTSLTSFSQYVLDGMTNATGAVYTTGLEMLHGSFTGWLTPERPLIWQNTGISNSTYGAVNTGHPSVDSSISNYGIISTAEWEKGTFSNAEAKRYNLYLGTTGLDPVPAPNFISGPTMFSKATINDPIQNRDGGVVITHGPSMDSFNQDFTVKILGNMVYKNGDEGAGKILTSSADGTVNISDAAAVIGGEGFLQGGNAFGATAELGTTDNHPLEIKANDNVALTVNPDGTVQYTDGTEGDGKILMSSSDGTLSAQSRDSVMNGVWRSGIVNNMGTHATLRTNSDTFTIMGTSGAPIMQSVGGRAAFGDGVRGNVNGLRFRSSAPSTGSVGFPIILDALFPTGATGDRVGTLLGAIGSTPTRISVLSIGRATSAGPTWVGIIDDNWAALATSTNYFMRATSFQPSSTNWFLYTDNPVKSQLPGNLLLGATSDNGHKLQVSGSIYGRNQSEPFNQFIMAESFTPTGTADASGEVGSMAWDDDYIYIKTSDGWKRSALSTF